MFRPIIFFSNHLAEPYVSRLQLWVEDFSLIVAGILAFVMAEALMMSILAIALSAGLWIYPYARAASAALLLPACRLRNWKLHNQRRA